MAASSSHLLPLLFCANEVKFNGLSVQPIGWQADPFPLCPARPPMRPGSTCTFSSTAAGGAMSVASTLVSEASSYATHVALW